MANLHMYQSDLIWSSSWVIAKCLKDLKKKIFYKLIIFNFINFVLILIYSFFDFSPNCSVYLYMYTTL